MATRKVQAASLIAFIDVGTALETKRLAQRYASTKIVLQQPNGSLLLLTACVKRDGSFLVAIEDEEGGTLWQKEGNLIAVAAATLVGRAS